MHYHAAALTQRASAIHACVEAGDVKRIQHCQQWHGEQAEKSDIAVHLSCYLYSTRRKACSDHLLQRMNVDMESFLGPSDFMRARTHVETSQPQK
jgi:hypothetical protein